ncbi:hypothetical protein EX30DRAFT_265861 [Ascodesmis nigricans]|uniref:Uncharacterized protein n=1 Tax=Ascodesmis nigricans TaxID=341454 RepID=A0A4S2MY55_9PEZI|nr:hypothetical protein EX30DRAFT_265861 [Ascodesmis nigricans]
MTKLPALRAYTRRSALWPVQEILLRRSTPLWRPKIIPLPLSLVRWWPPLHPRTNHQQLIRSFPPTPSSSRSLSHSLSFAHFHLLLLPDHLFRSFGIKKSIVYHLLSHFLVSAASDATNTHRRDTRNTPRTVDS